MITIPAGHKYATLALRVTHVTPRMTEPLDLGNDLWVTCEMPVALATHWQQWLGSIAVEELGRANLFLFSHQSSRTPGVVDQENIDLEQAVHRLYFAVLIAAPYFGHHEATMLSGAHHDGAAGVRHVQPYDEVLWPCGCHGTVLDDATFQLAAGVYDGLRQIEGRGEHDRVWRVVHAFYDGLKHNALGDRIHQFLRCIEGFIYPDAGNTRRQIASRTELFLGPSHHALMQTMFDIRSDVEHLHGPGRVINNADLMQTNLQLAEYSFKAEQLARYCLLRLLTTPTLWPHFTDDAALAAFWELPQTDRARLWGAQFKTTTGFSHFSRRTASIQLS